MSFGSRGLTLHLAPLVASVGKSETRRRWSLNDCLHLWRDMRLNPTHSKKFKVLLVQPDGSYGKSSDIEEVDLQRLNLSRQHLEDLPSLNATHSGASSAFQTRAQDARLLTSSSARSSSAFFRPQGVRISSPASPCRNLKEQQRAHHVTSEGRALDLATPGPQQTCVERKKVERHIGTAGVWRPNPGASNAQSWICDPR